MGRRLSTKRTHTAKAAGGFTLPEILVVLGIIALLAAIAIPSTLNQQSRAADVTVETDLTSAASAIDSALLVWRGSPPATLFICHEDNDFPSADGFPLAEVDATCEEGEWAAKVQGTWADPQPSLGGSLSPGVRLTGRISQSGEYCIMATSTRSGAGVFHIDSATAQVEPGTCYSSSWVDPSTADSEFNEETDPDLPGAQGELELIVVENAVTVSWTAAANTTYSIYVTGQPLKYLQATTAGTVTCIFPAPTCEGPASSPLPMGEYTATVRAQGPSGWGPGAEANFSISTSVSAPTAPQSLVVVPGDASAQLTWLAPQSTLDGQAFSDYYIFQSTNATGPWTQIAVVSSDVFSYTITGLQNGTPYWFRIMASNEIGHGVPATTAQSVTPSPPLSAPTGLATVPGNAQVALSWNPIADPAASGYLLERSTDGVTWIVAYAGAGTSTTVSGLTNGTLYFFRVAATDSTRTGTYSSNVPATPVAPTPSAPINLAAVEGARSLALSWSTPASNGGATITGYKVEYSVAGANDWTLATTTAATSHAITFAGGSAAPSTLPANWVGRKYDVRVSAVTANGTGTAAVITNKQPTPGIGDNVYGGYYAGMIDTRSIGGKRYLLVMSPYNLESNIGVQWRTSNGEWAPTATQSRWNGLAATEAMVAAGTSYSAANWAWSRPVNTSDGGSKWYVPAKDELELLYRNFKPTSENNWTGSGANPSSLPTGSNYALSASPSIATDTLFRQAGGAQALAQAINGSLIYVYYWSSTECSIDNACTANVAGVYAGLQAENAKNNGVIRVRPVRQVEF